MQVLFIHFSNLFKWIQTPLENPMDHCRNSQNAGRDYILWTCFTNGFLLTFQKSESSGAVKVFCCPSKLRLTWLHVPRCRFSCSPDSVWVLSTPSRSLTREAPSFLTCTRWRRTRGRAAAGTYRLHDDCSAFRYLASWYLDTAIAQVKVYKRRNSAYVKIPYQRIIIIGGNFSRWWVVFGMDCGDGFTDVHLPPNTSNCVH